MDTRMSGAHWRILLFILLSTPFSFGQPSFWREGTGPSGGFVKDLSRSDCYLFAATNALESGTGGVFRSEDDGLSWQRVTRGFDAYKVASGPNGLVLAASGSIGFATQVFRSTDAGRNWTFLSNWSLYALYVTSNRTVLASTRDVGFNRSTDEGLTWNVVSVGSATVMAIVQDNQGCLYAGTSQGVLTSTDEGISWTRMGLSNELISAIAADSVGYLYAAAWAQGVFRASRGDTVWQIMNEGLTSLFLRDIGCSYVDQVVVSTVGGGVYYSPNSGHKWMQASNPNDNRNTERMIVYPTGRIIIGTRGSGVFLSTDKGSSWLRARLPNTMSRSVAVTANGDIFACTAGSGVHRSSDDGRTWLHLDLPDSLLTTAIAVDEHGHIFVGTIYDRGVYRSTDGGNSWSVASIGLGDTDILSLVCGPGNSLFVGSMRAGVYHSTNDGENWFHLGLQDYSIAPIVFHPTGAIFVGVQRWQALSGGVFRSTDSGQNWTLLGHESWGNPDIAINTSGIVFLAAGIGYRSSDLGDTWTQVSRTPNGGGLGWLLVDLRDNLYSLGGGLFRSADNGTSWTIIDTSLSTRQLYAWSLRQNARGFLFVPTYGDGVVSSNDKVVEVRETLSRFPVRYELEQNYPNPFNPTTNIEFRIANFGSVTLKVFDLLGREVATLVDEVMGPGSYERVFHAEGLASGVYLYQLKAGGFVQTKKLLLLR